VVCRNSIIKIAGLSRKAVGCTNSTQWEPANVDVAFIFTLCVIPKKLYKHHRKIAIIRSNDHSGCPSFANR
jgi:hypothetical protein